MQTPTIRVQTGKGRSKKTKSVTVVQLHLSGPLKGGGSLAAYQLLSGKTKKHVTTFRKAVPLASVVYDPVALTITLTPAGKLKLNQPLQLRVSAGLLTDPYGRPFNGGQNFVATFG